MSSPDERRDARYDVPLGVPDPGAEPARRNGHRRVTAPSARPAAPAMDDEPDTSTDEPGAAAAGVPSPATPQQPA
ncbi:glycerol acyltransferase, partial [Micromonospora aurantiaca]|nr:glycerol acyltransferase [Micromonospora aurantiaca]